MNTDRNETTQPSSKGPKSAKRRHPYMMSNSREETIRRMRGFPERAAKFLEKFNADREKNSR